MGNPIQEAIERMVASAPPCCAGLIDQDRYIGNDPVGHSCDKVATEDFWFQGCYWRVCADCKRSLTSGEGRVTLPGWKARSGSDG